jgi:hypothetical protein
MSTGGGGSALRLPPTPQNLKWGPPPIPKNIAGAASKNFKEFFEIFLPKNGNIRSKMVYLKIFN